MNIEDVVTSQYQAALEMLKQAVVGCPDSLWGDPAYENLFWHVAYHALFYTHLYLQPTLEDFVPWEKHSDEHSSLRGSPSNQGLETDRTTAYSKDEVLEYLALCHGVVKAMVPQLDFGAPSGFHWLPFDKLELQFYNIRHLQHHTGELYERLGTKAQVDVRWVAMAPSS